jgi:hypothetical protein
VIGWALDKLHLLSARRLAAQSDTTQAERDSHPQAATASGARSSKKSSVAPCGCQLRTAHSPIVVIGGIGDSGTRGVAATVEALINRSLCLNGRDRVNLDCRSWRYPPMEAMLPRLLQRARGGSSTEGCGDHHSHSRDGANGRDGTTDGGNDGSTVGDQTSFMDALAAAPQCFPSLCSEVCKRIRWQEPLADANGTVWGWKEPESWVLMPLLAKLLGERLRFVHVVRDVRDVMLTSNQCQYLKFCDVLLANHALGRPCRFCHKLSPQCHPGNATRRLSCSPAHAPALASMAPTQRHETLVERATLWSDVNWHAHEYGTRVLGASRYLLLHVEELVSAAAAERTLRTLASFVGLSGGLSPSSDQLAQIARRNQAFASHYKGEKRSAAELAMLAPALAAVKGLRPASSMSPEHDSLRT